ncbi:hypothetical protein FKW77_002605 [Venturia effusa]|uniref:Myb-like domain-containing protein n=1 Tax=Venturia effusa TaxID=50376 RepID=A0A517KW06_9PEZI|nr:hypothetical protein FKW77_002605 [Venturia effusa]
MSSPGISRRIQNRVDAVFMPAGIQREVAEIIEIRKAIRTPDRRASRIPVGTNRQALGSITSRFFTMRLPGTFNLGGRNHLPTAEFLIHYENLKRAKARAKLEREANGGDKAEFGDKPSPKKITSASKKDGNDAKKDKRPEIVTTPDGDTFTKAQDDTIIQMKMEGKTWAMIGTEIGKDKNAVSSRFREIKPSDFDVKEKEWKEKNGGGGQNQGKKQQGQHNQNNQNEKKEHQKQGGKGNNNHNQNQDNQQHKEKKNKINNKNLKKQEEAETAGGAADDDTSDAGTWAVADENFTQQELTILEKIVEIELRNAFVRISQSFAKHPEGKRVHPDSIAQKVLGEALDLSSLGGSS